MDKGVTLAPFTTLKIGGKVAYFCRAKNEEEISAAAVFAQNKKLPIFILGGGSNVLVSDEGFGGVVVKIETEGISYEEESVEYTTVRAAAGENWDSLVADTVSRGFWGLENLSGIPGTVGAAPIQNIGAYGAEAKDTIESVRALDMRTKKEKVFSNEECRLEYRDSFFKSAEGKNFVVLEVIFRLSRQPKSNISYKDLAAFFASRKTPPSLSEIREAVIEIRSKKFPDLSKVGTAGSFFKNPIISAEEFDKLKTKYPELPFFAAKNGLPTGEAGIKVPLAYVLDKICGLKGFKKDSVELFQNQPLVLVNTGGATAKEISEFSAEIKKVVKEKTGLDIEEEVVCMP